MASIRVGRFQPAKSRLRIRWRFQFAAQSPREIGSGFARLQIINPPHHHSNLVRVERLVRQHRHLSPHARTAFDHALDARLLRAGLIAVALGYLYKWWSD